LKILQLAKENADEGITVDVVHVSLLKENVCLVKEQNSAPGMANVEDLLQLRLEEAGICTQFSGRHHVERALEQLADSFGGQGLAGTRRTVEDGWCGCQS
jgi:hypothetical protein